MIGGRSFVDLLKWNKVLQDLDLTGNEIPEDVHRSITTSLERNKERHLHEIHSKSHAETLNLTLQQLSHSHHEELERINGKLTMNANRAQTLSEKLEIASDEINRSQEALKEALAKIDFLNANNLEFQNTITKERGLHQNEIKELQGELIKERDRRMKLEDSRERIVNDVQEKLLKSECEFKKVDLEAQMLQRDKSLLLQEVQQYKEKEKAITSLWEGIYFLILPIR